MPLIQAIVLAVIQGITEFLPISSSAHLALAPWLFGWKDQGLNFDIALHIGTLAAVLIYFFRDWLQIIGQAFGQKWGHDPELAKNPKLLWYLVAASIPAGLAGIALKKTVETTFRSPVLMGTMLVVIALVMAFAERIGKKIKDLSSLRLGDAMTVGFAQVLALVPGTSRSGITVTAGLFRELDRHAAARFSFLLSTPVTAGAAVKGMYDLYKAGGLNDPSGTTTLLTGIIVSAITGCAAIGFLLHYLKRYSLNVFIYYRIIFGIIVIALAVFFRYPGE
jgi:undecaprenyl-diphosphatase